MRSSYLDYALDTSLDICNPLTSISFTPSMTSASWNGTAKVTSFAPEQPPQLPGGGIGVLCGSISSGPWMLLSKNAILVLACPEDEVWDTTQCITPTCDCNDGGFCNGVTIDYTIGSLDCICYSEFYGDNCEFADLPPPNSTHPTLTQFSRGRVVTFQTLDPSWEAVIFWENGTEVVEIGENYVYIPTLPRHSDPINLTLSVGSRSSNGSATRESSRD